MYDVIIIKPEAIKDGKTRFIPKNMMHKPSGEACPHLRWEDDGKATCTIHHLKWYKKTPCFRHSQIEQGDTPCRMGVYITTNPKAKERFKLLQENKDNVWN